MGFGQCECLLWVVQWIGCVKMQPFLKRHTKVFIDAREEKGWAHAYKTSDLSQNLDG